MPAGMPIAPGNNVSDELYKLTLAALSLGFFHTLLGPDHYVPFAAMARIGKWSLPKTITITILCGLGHVASSIILGLIGVAAGIALFKLETIEAARGSIAGWMLLAFGLCYFVWGISRAVRNRPHTHLHVHENGTVHTHEHTHTAEHLHVHSATHKHGAAAADHAHPAVADHAHPAAEANAKSMTPWVLFTIFLFGPCEPLIPLLMYPAAKASVAGVIWVTGLFALVTIATMTTIVVAMHMGISLVKLGRLERYGHALAGFVVLACGAAVKFGL